MKFLRPEALALLTRWAEPALSGAVLAIMLWVGGTMVWSGVYIGIVILIVAIGAGFWFRTALARARLGHPPLGPGVVVVDERRIAYMGPESGAFVALDSLVAIEIMTSDKGPYPEDASWVLHPLEGAPLAVPTGAEGADQLLETFAALPGFSYEKVVAAMGAAGNTRTTIWRGEAKVAASALASGAPPN